MREQLLSLMVFLPLITALGICFLPRKWEKSAFAWGWIGMVATFALSLNLFLNFQVGMAGYQFVQMIPWIPKYGVNYFVGLDGISLVLVVLTTILSPVALGLSFGMVPERKKEFVVSLLALETAMLGTFAALDIFLFYVFWETMLVPMYLLIGVFGGPRRIYATLKFFIYTMAGSLLMLIAVLMLYALHEQEFGFASASIPDLYAVSCRFDLQVVIYLLFLVAFAIKIPVFPFHTWLPDAHVEAPMAGSVILAGVLLKMGGYGILRLAHPMAPDAALFFAPGLGLLGVIGILYGAYLAWVQQDMKKLVAYSSVSHMGFVVLGLASLVPQATSGAVFQMIAHGISTGALFMLVGILYQRRHTRMLLDFGGLAKITPKLAAAFILITLASIGLPGLCGFVGEFLILVGSFGAPALAYPKIFVALSVIGIVLGAVYMLTLVERIFLGGVRFEENRKVSDLNWREGLAVLVPVILAIWLGIQPNVVLSRVSPSVDAIFETMKSKSDGIKMAERGRWR